MSRELQRRDGQMDGGRNGGSNLRREKQKIKGKVFWKDSTENDHVWNGLENVGKL